MHFILFENCQYLTEKSAAVNNRHQWVDVAKSLQAMNWAMILVLVGARYAKCNTQRRHRRYCQEVWASFRLQSGRCFPDGKAAKLLWALCRFSCQTYSMVLGGQHSMAGGGYTAGGVVDLCRRGWVEVRTHT